MTNTNVDNLKPKLIEWLRKQNAEITIDQRPKQRSILNITFFRGVYNIKKTYTLRYDKLTPMWCAKVSFKEGLKNTDEINKALLSIFNIEK